MLAKGVPEAEVERKHNLTVDGTLRRVMTFVKECMGDLRCVFKWEPRASNAECDLLAKTARA